MKVLINYDNGVSYFGELEYFSKYNRINARGIKEEARRVLLNKLGNSARYYKILDLLRID